MAFRESTRRHEISAEKEKDTREGKKALAPPSLVMSSEEEVTESCIWVGELMLPWTTALRLLWCLPFWKGWDLRRLICCWIPLGNFWLAQSRPGHAAAVSGDGGLGQMAWLNQGESLVLAVRLRACSWVCHSVFIQLGVREFMFACFRNLCVGFDIYVSVLWKKKQWRDATNLAVKTAWLEALSLTMIESIGADCVGAQHIWTLFSSSFNVIDSLRNIGLWFIR